MEVVATGNPPVDQKKEDSYSYYYSWSLSYSSLAECRIFVRYAISLVPEFKPPNHQTIIFFCSYFFIFWHNTNIIFFGQIFSDRAPLTLHCFALELVYLVTA